ncbi:PRMT7 [Symbiodinium necroappetens]|uniref:PRMT7 protein n=1 Tax=Symbiodinium necroappetens TaxID=1628268 RepID=A0A812KVG3_9DINO|nr:PRMT7 [Symbiodinium necroappetens]
MARDNVARCRKRSRSARNSAPLGKSGWGGCLAALGGPLSQLLACTSQELQRELEKKQSAKVLVLGGNGVSAVSALRAGAAQVVLWEPLPHVAAVAKEVVRRNLPEQVARCEITSEAIPSGPWDVVVVDRWHGSGLFSWGPAQCLRKAAAAASIGRFSSQSMQSAVEPTKLEGTRRNCTTRVDFGFGVKGGLRCGGCLFADGL